MKYGAFIRRTLLPLACFCFFQLSAEILGPELISNDEMPITLSASGTIHALSGDVTGNIIITGDDVTINLNQYVVTGRIIISGERALIYGGKVIAPAPADNATADAGVIQINVGADNTQIVDCYISAADTTVASVRGARGITVDANDVILRNNFIQAGSGAVNGVAAGGVGIQNSGINLIVDNSQIFGGNGSGSNLTATTSGAGGKGCNVVANSTLSMAQSICKGGNAGQLTNGANGITTGAGGDGVTIALGAQVWIDKSEIMGGDSSIITGPSMATTALVVGGDGGYGINSVADFLALYDSSLQGGNAGNVTIVSAIGSAAFSFAPGNGGAALHIGDTTTGPTNVRSCSIIGGNCGALTTTNAGGAGINNIIGDFYGALAGNGIEIKQQITNNGAYAIIEQCDIKGGLAQNITSASGLGTLLGVFGNSSGDGVVIDEGGSHVDIANCTVMTFKGGDLIAVSFGGAGAQASGNGGNGIRVADIFGLGAGESFIRISNNQLLSIGGGGVALGGTGGMGGYGIIVGDSTLGIEVSYNTITNSPGGDITSTLPGQSNFAILVGVGLQTIVYGNIAYAVTPATFTIFVYSFPITIPITAVDAPNGTPFALGIDRLANIYQL